MSGKSVRVGLYVLFKFHLRLRGAPAVVEDVILHDSRFLFTLSLFLPLFGFFIHSVLCDDCSSDSRAKRGDTTSQRAPPRKPPFAIGDFERKTSLLFTVEQMSDLNAKATTDDETPRRHSWKSWE